jgi:hypothetical protein
MLEEAQVTFEFSVSNYPIRSISIKTHFLLAVGSSVGFQPLSRVLRQVEFRFEVSVSNDPVITIFYENSISIGCWSVNGGFRASGTQVRTFRPRLPISRLARSGNTAYCNSKKLLLSDCWTDRHTNIFVWMTLSSRKRNNSECY